MLEKAIRIAVEAHQGQIDKAGAPYILHPLRLMHQMTSEKEMTAAVLHDVVEDSDVSLDDLRKAGVSDEVLDAVDSVTKRKGESYEDFILRAGLHPIGIKIKVADLLDNMDISRISEPTAKDYERLANKYVPSLARLRELEQAQSEQVNAIFFEAGGSTLVASALLTPRSLSHPGSVNLSGSAGTYIVSEFASFGTAVFPDEYMEIRAALKVKDAARLYELNPTFVPFFCRECGAIYAQENWQILEGMDFDPDIMHCPVGHRKEWKLTPSR